MAEAAEFIEVSDARARRRAERRDLFKAVLGAGALGAGFAFASAAQAQSVTDNDILNFALNLEYLEAQFYAYAFSGAPGTFGQTGSGAQGGVDTGGTAPPRAVNFAAEPLIGQIAREIAADEAAHVQFLRTALAGAQVAQPRINISGGLNADGTPGAFTAAARAAGIATTTGTLDGAPSATGTFDPYSSPDAFLLGAFIFEDVGVTAYKGAVGLLTSNTLIDAAAGIHATEAFHAGIIRGQLYNRGANAPSLRTASEAISNARDSLDGPSDIDQGVAPVQTTITSAAGASTGTASNFVPTDANGIVFSRTTGQVLNIIYLNRASVTLGGFFPAGVNGTIRTSAAN